MLLGFFAALSLLDAPTVMALADKYGLAMPIARDVFDVTQGKRDAQEVFRGLLRSSVGDEAHPG